MYKNEKVLRKTLEGIVCTIHTASLGSPGTSKKNYRKKIKHVQKKSVYVIIQVVPFCPSIPLIQEKNRKCGEGVQRNDDWSGSYRGGQLLTCDLNQTGEL